MADSLIIEGATTVAARSLGNLDVHGGLLGARLGGISTVIPGQYIVKCHGASGADCLAAAAAALYESVGELGPLAKHENALVSSDKMCE